MKDAHTEAEATMVAIPATEELVKNLAGLKYQEDVPDADDRGWIATGATKTVVFARRVRSKAEDENKRAENKAQALSVHP